MKRAIVDNTLHVLREPGVTRVCEGVETLDEFPALRDLGVDLMQGYLFSKPCVASLAVPAWPATDFELPRAVR